MYSNREAEERHSGEVAKSLRMTNGWVTYTERRSVISVTDQKVNGTQLWVIRPNLKREQGKQERKYTITGGVSAELFTKRRWSINCRSGDGYVASEVSDCDRTWVYNRLEALRSHEASHSRDTNSSSRLSSSAIIHALSAQSTIWFQSPFSDSCWFQRCAVHQIAELFSSVFPQFIIIFGSNVARSFFTTDFSCPIQLWVQYHLRNTRWQWRWFSAGSPEMVLATPEACSCRKSYFRQCST